MALFEVVLQCRYQNQQIINRWTYQGSGTPAAVSMSFGLVSALGFIQGDGDLTFPVGSMAEAIRNLTNTQVAYIQVQARDIYSALDFYDTPFNAGTVGENSGNNTASPALAFGFRSNRTRLDVGRAYKRITGVTEAGMTDGGTLGVLAADACAIVATRMGATVTYDDEGNTLTYSPIVLGKEKYVVPSSGRNAYRYYATQAEQEMHMATGIQWDFYDTVRTQTSRQYGRGQ